MGIKKKDRGPPHLLTVMLNWIAQTTQQSAPSCSIRVVAMGYLTIGYTSVKTVAPKNIGSRLTQRGRRKVDNGWGVPGRSLKL